MDNSDCKTCPYWKQHNDKRDHLAAMAMQGILPSADVYNNECFELEYVASIAYKIADAMLAERNSPKAKETNK